MGVVSLELSDLYKPLTSAEIKQTNRNARRVGRILVEVPDDLREVKALPFDEIRSILEGSNPEVRIGSVTLDGSRLKINYFGGVGGLNISGLEGYIQPCEYGLR
jgi:hypothetical protein